MGIIESLTRVGKQISAWISDGTFLSGHPELLEMDLDRDYENIDHLIVTEQWPFLRSDLTVSHCQPKATAFIARKDGKFAGFFLTHHFSDVGYLDMMIIAKEFRKHGIARPLYFKTIRKLKQKRISSFVVHTTNDSARIIKLLGFRPGQTFTLIARDSGTFNEPVEDLSKENIVQLTTSDKDKLIFLDGQVFGIARREWIESLLAQPSIKFFGLVKNGQLAASVCLRPRRDNAFCLDTANAYKFEDLEHLLRYVIAKFQDRRIECFALTGSFLHHALERMNFNIPEFFKAIGPLIEWRKGQTRNIGISPLIQCLSWF